MLNEIEQRIVDCVEEYGWYALSIAPRADSDDPEEWFTYTIGLPKSHGWPELICFGLASERHAGTLASPSSCSSCGPIRPDGFPAIPPARQRSGESRRRLTPVDDPRAERGNAGGLDPGPYHPHRGPLRSRMGRGRRMMKLAGIVLIASFALAGCHKQGDAHDNEVTAASDAGAVPPAAPPQPDAANGAANDAVPAPVCAPPPALALLPDFADPRHGFAPEAPPFRATQANFAAAYAQACRSGMLHGDGLGGRLFLRNAPNANVAGLYRDGEEGAPAASRRLVLEYPFVTDDGIAHVPAAEELGEAIYCHVHGASPREQEETGRCLPD
jgi:Domain of unknown function (DUF4262)